MGKGDYINGLFNDIKDYIEFDSDVIALNKLLKRMLNINTASSFNNWKYIIESYDILNLMLDINFMPILKDFPAKLIEKNGIEEFFLLMESFNNENRKLVYFYLFNIYESKCILLTMVEKFIDENDEFNEKKFIDLVITNSKNFAIETFDIGEFLKKVILLHLNKKIIPLELLQEFTDIPESVKEKALLKTLLIDYI